MDFFVIVWIIFYSSLHFHLFSKGSVLWAQYCYVIFCSIQPVSHCRVHVPQLVLTIIQLSNFLQHVLTCPIYTHHKHRRKKHLIFFLNTGHIQLLLCVFVYELTYCPLWNPSWWFSTPFSCLWFTTRSPISVCGIVSEWHNIYSKNK